MNEKLLVTLIIFALLAGFSFYMAVDSSGGPNRPVPTFQTEAQVSSVLNGPNPFDVSVGIDAQLPLVKQQVHFWVPGLDPSPGATPCKQYTPHRYPALSGGNLSTIMHHGWSQMCESAPADNDWRLNPPEVAVL